MATTEEDPPAPPLEDESETDNVDLGKLDAAYIQYRALYRGFNKLRNQLDGLEIEGDDEEDLGDHLSKAPDDGDGSESSLGDGLKTIQTCATVNFIDPTSSTTDEKALASGRPPSKRPMELFEKLSSNFAQDYDSTLRQVPYKDIRSGSNKVIDDLPVKLMLTKNHVGTANGQEALTPWGGAATAPTGDPAEWHNGPFCHVYIAACENMTHYRNKVRPAIQAFVSQIEGAANNYNSSASGDGSTAPTGGNYSSHFIIVFVPIGPRAISDASEAASNTRMGAAFSRLANVRNRVRNEVSSDSVHSVATTGTDSSDHEDPMDVSMNSTASRPGAGHFSKEDKELFRKFNADFPNGTTCILSTLLENNIMDDPRLTALKQQEWNTFTRSLGAAIVDGFKDRCRRYDEELRRLQALPTANSTSKSPLMRRKQIEPKKGSGKEGGLDLGHFFLVKESLAFTYEQLHLPQDALLQYEELRAFLPDIADIRSEDRKRSRRRRSSLEGDSAVMVALSGDIPRFRKRMRSVTSDLKDVAHVVLQYIFARETDLLFKMKDPVELLRRCLAFAKTMYEFHAKAAAFASEEEEQKHLENYAEEWALTFCWDVKCASEVYFTLMDPSSKASMYGEYPIVKDAEVETILKETSLARELSTLMDFGRIRLMQLADSKLKGPNPLRQRSKGMPEDMRKPWDAWDEKDHLDAASQQMDDDCITYSKHDQFLTGAFESEESFIKKYLEITSSIVTFALFAGRQRIAARLQGELADILIKQGKDLSAIKSLIATVNILAKDQWDKCHFWRLLRLASCQRRVGRAADYLQTLVNCFGPNISNVAPSKALDLLLGDLEAVVSNETISGAMFRSVPFLATRLEVEETSSGESSMSFGPERKQLNKKFCTVGETVRISLITSSFLPKGIEVDSVRLSLVAFGTYASKIESKTPLDKDDVFKVLTLEPPTTIESGVNSFSFDWVPINTGQYILASIEIKWKEAVFFYDSLEMRRSLVGIDVLPSDPSQSITLEPYFLVPGHIQPVRILFYAGSDVITRGTVNLTCTPGVELIPPGEEVEDGNWTDSCSVNLPACSTGETTVLTTSVKTPEAAVVAEEEEEMALHAKVATLYRHADYAPGEDEDETNMPCMKTVLEAMVPTLENPVLTVECADVFPNAVDGFLISITLNCNSPVPYHVKSWKLDLPPPLVLLKDGDLNQNLFDVAVMEGENLSFGFSCKRDPEAKDAPEDDADPVLHIELEDEFETVFDEILYIDLQAFYAKVRRDSKLSGLSSVAVELKESATGGVVGEPVTFKYSIDTTGLETLRKTILPKRSIEAPPCFLYTVEFNQSDWVVGGNLQGEINITETGSFPLSLVGIPTRPGVIKGFPSITLKCETPGGDLLQLLVDMRQPETFNSRSFGGQMAVACPQRK